MPIAISQSVVTATNKLVQADRQRRELIDSKAPGLILRVGVRETKWSWKTESRGTTHRLELGTYSEWTIAEARDLAIAATDLVRNKSAFPDADWLHRRRIEMGKIERPVVEKALTAREFSQWSFAEARKSYVDHVARVRRSDTAQDYSQLLHCDELSHLDGEKVSRIKRRDMSKIVEKIHQSGRERYAEKIAGVVRTMWTYLSGDNQLSKSGVERGEMIGLRAPDKTLRERGHADPAKAAVKKYVPPMMEVGRILAIARSGAFDLQQSAAIELLVFGVQRRRAIVTTWREDFEPAAGGGIWFVMPANRKRSDDRDEAHAVPLVQRVFDRMMEQSAAAAPDPHLFPKYRDRRKGQSAPHMSVEVVTRALLLMPGVEASPQDMRRAFGTHGEKALKLTRKQTKMILDHSEGEASGDVTGNHYALHDGTHLKWPIVRKWSKYVESFVQPAIDADPRLLDVEWLKREIATRRIEIANETPPKTD